MNSSNKKLYLLHYTVLEGNWKLVKELLKEGYDVNRKDESGQTPLHFLFYSFDVNIHILNELLLSGASVNIENNWGQTCLHLALLRGVSLPIIQVLLKYGADVTIQEKVYDNTPLHCAIYGYSGDDCLDIVKELINRGASLSVTNKFWLNPAFLSIIKGCNGVLQELINNGADIFEKDQNGNTLLHYLFYTHGKQLKSLYHPVRNLLRHFTSHKRTPLVCKKPPTNLEIVKILVEHGLGYMTNWSGFLPIHCALLFPSGNLDAIKELLKDDVINKRNDFGETPLHLAARNGMSLEIIQELFKHNCDSTAKDHNGNKPLHCVFQCKGRGNLNVIKHILKYDTEVNEKNNDGQTPLHILAEKGKNYNVLQELLNNGSDINIKDYKGNTVLHYVCWGTPHGKLTLMKEFLGKGVSVNEKNYNERTVLHEAIARGMKLELVQEILKYHPKVNEKDKDGNYPMHLDVCHGRNPLVINELINHGGNVHLKNGDGRTPLHLLLEMCPCKLSYVKMFLQNGAFLHEINSSGEIAFNAIFDNPVQSIYVESSNVLQELLKYCLIEHCSEIHCLLCSSLQQKYEESFGEYVNEIKRMKNVFVNNTTTLYDLVVIKKYNSENECNLPKDFQTDFPKYHEIVLNCLKKKTQAFESPPYIPTHYNTSLHQLFRYKTTDIMTDIKEILKHGESVNEINEWRETPLHVAIRKHMSFDVIQELLKSGAVVRSMSLSGNNILNHAVVYYKDNPEVIKELLKYGAIVHMSAPVVFSGIKGLIELSQVAQEVLKYMLVEHSSQINCPLCTFVCRDFAYTVSKYLNEINKMKKDIVIANISLYDFVIHNEDFGKMSKHDPDFWLEGRCLIDKISKEYPEYSEIILNSLETSTYLIIKFRKLMSVLENNLCSSQIALCSDYPEKIASSLSRHDIRNFIKAFLFSTLM